MTDEERTEVQNHAKAIASILHKDSKNKEPEKLKTLEGKEKISDSGIILLDRTERLYFIQNQ